MSSGGYSMEKCLFRLTLVIQVGFTFNFYLAERTSAVFVTHFKLRHYCYSGKFPLYSNLKL